MVKRRRRLQALLQQWPSGMGMPYPATCILSALHKNEAADSPWLPRFLCINTRDKVQPILDDVLKAILELTNVAKQGRRDRWHVWCNDPRQQARVYRYIRQGPAPFRVSEIDPTSAHQPGKLHDLAMVDNWWWKLWNPPSCSFDAARWLPALDHFPQFPELAPLTGTLLQALLKTLPSGKAPGRDGWTYGDFKRMPVELLSLLALFFEVVEETGIWPETVGHSFVAMLPKGGTGTPDDHRPIVLLSVVYRIWAKARGPPFQAFLRAAGVLGKGKAPAAEDLAYELAVRMGVAQAGGTPVAGLAVDWSKCYDNLLLGILTQVAERARIPPALAKPMIAAYRQPRAVLLQGAVGPEKQPIAGLAPGCPRATDWLALVVYMFTSTLEAAYPGVRSRPYVDDITSEVVTADTVAAVEIVTHMVDHTMDFARDMAFQPNAAKTRRFATLPAVKAALEAIPGPPLAKAFLDLGIVQTPTPCAAPALSDKRLHSGLDKFERTATLAVPFCRRIQYCAASGVPAALYGIAAQPISALRLAALQSSALRAMWRSSSRSASELVMALFVPWRASPVAYSIIKTCLAMRSCILSGGVELDALAWAYHCNTAVGPFRALQDALSRIGARLSPDGRTILGPQGPLLWLTGPTAHVRDDLLGRVQDKALQALAKRRPILAGVASGFDRFLTLQYDRSDAPEVRKAALRVLQTGGSIVQQVAAKWVPGGGRCPFCLLAIEDVHHMLWACPRWAMIRQQGMRALSRAAVEATLGTFAMLTGIIPTDPVLRNAQVAAEASGFWPPPIKLPGRVWSDGSCLHPADPILRRATWSVVGSAPEYATLARAPVHGRQTIGRAELSAVIWVSRCPDATGCIIDAQYLIGCMVRCADGIPPPALLQGPNGDLWMLLSKVCSLFWVRAHRTAQQALDLGIPEEDRLGNIAADAAAGELAAMIAPSQALVGRRYQAMMATEALHRTMAAIQEAAIAHHHAPEAAVRKRRRPKRKLLRPKRAPPRGPRPDTLGLLQPRGTPLVHALEVAPGPRRPDNVEAGWLFTCTACASSVHGVASAGPFAKARCTSSPLAAHARRETLVHELFRVPRGWACLRCRLAVSSARRASASRARCPVTEYFLVDGSPCLNTRLQIQVNLAAIAAWKAARPIVVVALVGIPPLIAPPHGPVWLPHWVLQGPLRTACLQCGRSATARARVSLQSSPCEGLAARPAAGLVAPLLGGAFDLALANKPAAWLARARDLGWLPIRREPMPERLTPVQLCGGYFLPPPPIKSGLGGTLISL
jgi:hypothetical protein